MFIELIKTDIIGITGQSCFRSMMEDQAIFQWVEEEKKEVEMASRNYLLEVCLGCGEGT